MTHDIMDAIGILCLAIIGSSIFYYLLAMDWDILVNPVWLFLAVAAGLFLLLKEN